MLSDILGLSLLVDSIDHPKPDGSTEGTVLGPFHTHEAESIANGGGIASDPDGQPLLVLCTVKVWTRQGHLKANNVAKNFVGYRWPTA